MDALQFREKLHQIGYPDARKLPLNAFGYLLEDEDLAPFFELFSQIDESNILTPEEVARYEALETSGAKILELDELEAASVGSKEPEVPIEDLRMEVFLLSEELITLEQEKVMQEKLKETLSKHITSTNAHCDEAIMKTKAAKKTYQRAMMDCQVANKEMNTVFEEVKAPLSTIEQIVEMAATSTPESPYLAFAPVEDFLKTFEEYNILLKEYTNKQFNMGKTKIAELGSDVNNKLIDLKAPPFEKPTDEQVKMYKLLKMHHDNFCKVENQLVIASANENGMRKKIKAGKDLLAALNKGVFPQAAILSHKITENKAEEAGYNAEVENLKDNIIPKLVYSLADANATIIITGNYDLKWKRQKCFISKMDQLIFWLAEHMSLAEFYSLGLTSEYGICKQTRQFLEFVRDTSKAQLDGYQGRMAAMKKLCTAVRKIEDTEKGNSVLLETIEKMMQSYSGLQKEKRVLSRNQRLLDKLEYMKDDMVNSEMKTKEKFFEQTKRLEQINSRMLSLKDAIWADRPTKTGPPHLGPKEIDDSLKAIEDKFKKLFYDFMSASLQLEEKKRMLDCDGKLKKLRTSYLDFYDKLV